MWTGLLWIDNEFFDKMDNGFLAELAAKQRESAEGAFANGVG